MQVNPKGGAIALGHPLGATGARMMATLMPELKKKLITFWLFFFKLKTIKIIPISVIFSQFNRF